MSTEDQDIFREVFKKWTMENVDIAEQRVATYLQQATDYGIEIQDFTTEQWKANARVTRPVEWPTMEEGIGKDRMAEILARATSVD